MKGEQITGLYSLDLAARNRRAVTSSFGWLAEKPKPAAVVMSMQARVVLRLIKSGLWVYEKEKKEGK